LCCPHEYQDDTIRGVKEKSKTQKPIIPAERLDEKASYVHSQGKGDSCQYEHDTTHYNCRYRIESKLVDVGVHLRGLMHLDLLNGICLTTWEGVGGLRSMAERRKSLVMILLKGEK
jgi:hypothetical protein